MALRLSLGANIDEKGGPLEMSALHVASFAGRDAVVVILLEHGADLTAKDMQGRTAIHWAASEGHLETCQLLLDRGADLLSKTIDGRTPEDMARQNPFSVAGTSLQIVAMLKAEMRRREAVRRAQCVAFAMGHQERLGAGSRVQWLDAGVMRMVLEEV